MRSNIIYQCTNRKMRIRKLIRSILPYGIVEGRRALLSKKRAIDFITNSSQLLPNTDNKHKIILSIQGFGYSGHTALVNLFQEYKNIQECTKTTVAGESSYEIDFMRLGGGILDFERYLDSSNIFQNDAAFHRLLKQMASCVVFKEDTRCKDLADSYLSGLVDMKLADLSSVYYNAALADRENPDTSIYYIKNLQVEAFREYTKRFLSAFFNVFYTEGKETLMLDHFFTDYEWDMKKYNDYIPGIKVIALYRDPRDVYYYANLKHVEWIPHTNVDDFIKWCGKTYGKFDMHATAYYPLRFEDLVLDYENTVAKLEAYVGLKPEDHVDKLKFLNPEVSKNNIAIWKKAPELASDMDKINSSLGALCYH